MGVRSRACTLCDCEETGVQQGAEPTHPSGRQVQETGGSSELPLTVPHSARPSWRSS